MPPYTRLALLIALLSPILGKIRFPHFSSISSPLPTIRLNTKRLTKTRVMAKMAQWKKRRARGPVTTTTTTRDRYYLVWNCVCFRIWPFCQKEEEETQHKWLSFEAIGIFGSTHTQNPVRLMGVDIFDLYSTLPTRKKPQPHKNYYIDVFLFS